GIGRRRYGRTTVRTPWGHSVTGMAFDAGTASAIASSICGSTGAAAPPRIVTEPPAPPAPLTFHPLAPYEAAVSMTRCAASPTRVGCRRALHLLFHDSDSPHE